MRSMAHRPVFDRAVAVYMFLILGLVMYLFGDQFLDWLARVVP